jgi:hypothetical protein
MRNVSDKSCRENQNTRGVFSNYHENRAVYVKNVEKYCRARQATDDKTAHVHCMLDTYGYKYTQIVEYSLFFHCNNGCTNAPQCYVIRTLPLLFYLVMV